MGSGQIERSSKREFATWDGRTELGGGHVLLLNGCPTLVFLLILSLGYTVPTAVLALFETADMTAVLQHCHSSQLAVCKAHPAG